MNPRDLPVYKERDRIVDALKDHQVIVVESPTGSGKTTQLPLILHEAGFAENGMVGVTQPRRIAAVSVSEYIAKQTKTTIPGLVGYKMRFEDKTERTTRIKVMTDGILLQELKADPTLSQYSVIVVDEAHERSLNIDFILGLLKRVLEMRESFRVIVSSATINANIFSEYFNQCFVVRIETPTYPVQVIYDAPAQNDYDEILDKVSAVIERIMDERREGDILVFLSGEKMIKDCIALLSQLPCRRKLQLVPLYGRLSREEQDRVFPQPPRGKTKVVVATNIAETSITIDGITSVIDSGLAKLNYYNPRTFTSSLVENPISKASANQRKGRAGRTRPGSVYRLYPKEDFDSRELFTKEEIYRTDLSEVVLRMAELGITDFESFDFISSPGAVGIAGAVETLNLLGALTPDHTLSKIGTMMVAFPLLPRHSRMIVEAIYRYPEVLGEIITAVSFLTTNAPFLLPPGEELAARKAHHRYRDPLGDFVSYLHLFSSYRNAEDKIKFCASRYLDDRAMAEISNINDQLTDIVSELGVPISRGGSKKDFLCAAAAGLIQFVCVRTGRDFRSLTAERVQIHPGSVMFKETPRYIVAGEIVRTTRTYARSVSPLEESWLPLISKELAEQLISWGKPGAAKGPKSKRDTSMQISIGGEVFELSQTKGKKKTALLDWDKLSKVLRSGKPTIHPQFHKLKGKLMIEGGKEILAGETVATIIRIGEHIDPQRDYIPQVPRRQTYSAKQLPELCSNLNLILKAAPLKKSARSLGFVALYSNETGQFWFKPARNFHTAVSESIASLELLADELDEDADSELVSQVGVVYRHLEQLLDT
jgi:ATP-dependent helicase HrpA